MSKQNTERDTHFAGFARVLLDELKSAPLIEEEFDSFDERATLIIARRAYDLAYHTLGNTTQAMAASCEHRPDVKEELLHIPDLTEWPEIY